VYQESGDAKRGREKNAGTAASAPRKDSLSVKDMVGTYRLVQYFIYPRYFLHFQWRAYK